MHLVYVLRQATRQIAEVAGSGPELRHQLGKCFVRDADCLVLWYVEDFDRLVAARHGGDQRGEAGAALEPGGAEVPADDVIDLQDPAAADHGAGPGDEVAHDDGVAEGAGAVPGEQGRDRERDQADQQPRRAIGEHRHDTRDGDHEGGQQRTGPATSRGAGPVAEQGVSTGSDVSRTSRATRSTTCRGAGGTRKLLPAPPAPRQVVERVAREVLDASEPVDTPLLGHGPRATRRRWTRALLPALVVTVAGVVLPALADGPSWLLVGLVALPVAALLAWDRTRSLGHAVVVGHLVARSGSVVRRRRILEVDHVIGWNLRATWFQRRAGLTTLVATMAGGNQAVEVLDVPEHEAVRVAHEALPELVSQFRA